MRSGGTLGQDAELIALTEGRNRDPFAILGPHRDRFLALGSYDNGAGAQFNMTALALRSAGKVNAVSRVHGAVMVNYVFDREEDPFGRETGRYYSADQLPQARIVAQLRRAGIPVEEIAAYFAHPDGERLYASVLAGTVVEVSTPRHDVLRTFVLGGTPQGIAVSRDGTELYVANEAGDPAGGLEIWDLGSGTRLERVAIGGLGFGLAVSPDGAQIYVSRSLGGDVKIVSVESRAVVGVLRTGGRPRRIGFNAAGTMAVIANEAGWVDFIR